MDSGERGDCRRTPHRWCRAISSALGRVGWHLSKNGSGIAFVGPVRSHLLVRLTQGRAGHCLLRICQETHHIVAAGLSLHSARHLFAARDPWWRGSSGPVRPQSRRLAASGYRMAYRVSSCRRGIPPGVALRDAAVFARALQHLFPLSCRGRSSARPSRSSLFGARGDPGRSTGSRRGLMDT